MYKPFTIADYSGNSKSKSCAEYMRKFITELSQLLSDGVTIQKKFLQVKNKLVVCDTPARAFLKCIVSHGSFNACERCKTLAKKIDNVTVLLQRDALARTDEGFRTFIDPDCHTGLMSLR